MSQMKIIVLALLLAITSADAMRTVRGSRAASGKQTSSGEVLEKLGSVDLGVGQDCEGTAAIAVGLGDMYYQAQGVYITAINISNMNTTYSVYFATIGNWGTDPSGMVASESGYLLASSSGNSYIFNPQGGGDSSNNYIYNYIFEPSAGWSTTGDVVVMDDMTHINLRTAQKTSLKPQGANWACQLSHHQPKSTRICQATAQNGSTWWLEYNFVTATTVWEINPGPSYGEATYFGQDDKHVFLANTSYTSNFTSLGTTLLGYSKLDGTLAFQLPDLGELGLSFYSVDTVLPLSPAFEKGTDLLTFLDQSADETHIHLNVFNVTSGERKTRVLVDKGGGGISTMLNATACVTWGQFFFVVNTYPGAETLVNVTLPNPSHNLDPYKPNMVKPLPAGSAAAGRLNIKSDSSGLILAVYRHHLEVRDVNQGGAVVYNQTLNYNPGCTTRYAGSYVWDEGRKIAVANFTSVDVFGF